MNPPSSLLPVYPKRFSSFHEEAIYLCWFIDLVVVAEDLMVTTGLLWLDLASA
jgi:hypothetical protein